MSKDYTNLLSMDFLPLSEAKAKLSEQMRKIITEGKRIGITTNGRPTAVMLSYTDYLKLLERISPSQPEQATQSMAEVIGGKEERDQEGGNQEAMRNTILELLEPELDQKAARKALIQLQKKALKKNLNPEETRRYLKKKMRKLIG